MSTIAGNSTSSQLFARFCLVSAACVPIIYFATQLAAAPFYPGYSFSHQLASELGMGLSRQPWIFNTGIFVTGLALIVAAFGLFQSFRMITHLRLSLLIAAAVAYSGFCATKAGVFPLPDPHHGTKLGLTAPLLMPLLMLIATWGKDHLRGLQWYLSFSVLLLVPVALILERILSIAWLPIGTIQRLLALGTYVPVGVVGAYFLLRGRRPEDESFGGVTVA